MNCPRCDGLVIKEHIRDPQEGPLSGFRASRCLNCGAINDDVIRMNQRLSPSLKRFPSPRRRSVPRFLKISTTDALAIGV